MKIKTQIFIMGLLLSLVPLAVVSTMLIIIYHAQLNQVVEDEVRSITTAQIEIIDNFFQERNSSMAVLSDYDILHELLEKSNRGETIADSDDKALMERILKAQKNKMDSLYSITAVDLNLKIVACTEETKPGDVNQLPSLASLDRLGTEVRISPIVEAGEFGARKRCIVATKVIYNGKQERIGYLIEEIGVEFFSSLRISTDLIKEGYIYITDGAGGLITAGSGDDNRGEFVTSSEQRGSFEEKWAQRDLNQPVSVVGYTVDGHKYLSGYGGFSNSEWQILASIGLDEILNTKKRLLQLLVAALAVVALVVVMVNVVMRRLFTTPMEQMFVTFEAIRKDKDFSKRIEGIPDNEMGGIADGINSLLSDIEHTIRHQEEHLQTLKERAERDPMTKLLNKEEIERVISMKLENLYIHHRCPACVLLDIDNFKDFNTDFGHAGGDKVICFVAEAMREISGDTAGRIGGDEFVMWLDSYRSQAEVARVLEVFQRKLHAGIAVDEGTTPISVSCSIGAIVLRDGAGATYESVMQAADQAMYEVKHANKDGILILEA